MNPPPHVRTEGDPAPTFILPEISREIDNVVAASGGNEVFFIGTMVDGLVSSIEVVARGDSSSVLVFLDRAPHGSVLIHNHPGGDLTPSNADFSIASEAGMRGLGFVIVDNHAERVYRVVEPVGDEPDATIEPEEIERILGPDGPLAAEMPGYEAREGQIEMSKGVAAAFNDEALIACEAGTGVGKSFAYLVPAILWAVRAKSRVVVSTQTIALSEQLVDKDLPRLRRILDVDFQFALLKGRGNYACRRKTEEVRNDLRSGLAFGTLEDGEGESSTDADDLTWMRTIAEALEKSETGSLSSFETVPPNRVWDAFQSSSEQSLKVKCPHYESCWFYNARRKAAGAQIVVANHHLVLADLAVRRATNNFESDVVLPPYKRIVFDEAHRLEDVAAQHFGVQLSRMGVSQILGRLLSRRRGGRRENGRFARAVRRLQEVGQHECARRLEDELLPVARMAKETLDEPFDAITDELLGVGASDRPLDESATLRVVDDHDEEGRSAQNEGSGSVRVPVGRVLDSLRGMREEIHSLARATARARSRIEDATFEPQSQHEGLVAEFRSSHQSLVHLVDAIDAFARPLEEPPEVADELGDLEPGAEFEALPKRVASAPDAAKSFGGAAAFDVRWIELHAGRFRNVVLRRAPVRVGPLLAESLYDRTDTACFTSATLTVADRWDYPSGRLGWDRVEASRFTAGTFASPFDFEKQSILILPNDLPSPDDRSFVPAFGEMLIDAVHASKGRAFVLFTSHRMLRAVAGRVKPVIEQAGYPCLVQGMQPVSALLERFRSSGRAVLFGNQSFWEGIDVAGDALSLVVIARLPFRVPSHPLEEGRAEDVRRRGGNPFRDLTLPQSVLALKQGVGRLIRTKTDRGVVIIADGRVSSRGYGRSFLSSLPPSRAVRGPWSEGHRAVREFFGGPGQESR